MYPPKNYEMTEEDLNEIMDASKPTVCILVGGYSPPTPQENANRAWARLGKKMGFDHMTVRPIQGKENRFFTAVPNETDEQKEDRLNKEAENKKNQRILQLEKEISERHVELKALTG